MVTLQLAQDDAEQLAKALSDYREVLIKRAYRAFKNKQFNQVIGIQSFIKKRINKIHMMLMIEIEKEEKWWLSNVKTEN